MVKSCQNSSVRKQNHRFLFCPISEAAQSSWEKVNSTWRGDGAVRRVGTWLNNYYVVSCCERKCDTEQTNKQRLQVLSSVTKGFICTTVMWFSSGLSGAGPENAQLQEDPHFSLWGQIWDDNLVRRYSVISTLLISISVTIYYLQTHRGDTNPKNSENKWLLFN